MTGSLRILHLEADAAFAARAWDCLRAAGWEGPWVRVDSRDGYLEALADSSPDLILADHLAPALDGLSALALARQRLPDIPFLFLSRALGEQLAVDSLKQGAVDYVLKSALRHLPLAVGRACREAGERSLRRRVEEEARVSENLLAALIDSTDDPICAFDRDLRLLRFNSAYRANHLAHFGCEPEPGECAWDWPGAPEVLAARRRIYGRALAGERFKVEWNFPIAGRIHQFELSLNPIRCGGEVAGVAAFYRDITARKRAEEELRVSEARLAAQVEGSPDAIWTVDRDLRLAGFNATYAAMLRRWYGREPAVGMPLGARMPGLASETQEERYRRALAGESFRTEDPMPDGEDGLQAWEFHYRPARSGGSIMGVTVHARDVSALRLLERRLRESEAAFRLLASETPAAVLIQVGARLEYANPAAEALLGAGPAQWQGLGLEDFLPAGQRRGFRESAARVAAGGGREPAAALVRLDGGEVAVEASLSACKYLGREALMLVARIPAGPGH